MKHAKGEITSSQNPRIKRVVSLRDQRHRRQEQRYLIDGAREVGRAIQARAPLEEVFVCVDLCQSPLCQQMLELVDSRGVGVWLCSARVFEKIAFGNRAEGILALGITPDTSLEKLSVPGESCVGVLVGIEKPGNVGAVIRSADGAGFSALLIADGGTDLFNPNCIRASLGTIFNLPVATTSSAEAISWLRERHYRIWAARPNASLTYTEADFRGTTAIVLGSEAHGLPPVWNDLEMTSIRLPMHGIADSLNVSVTAGILFYEALRQRVRD